VTVPKEMPAPGSFHRSCPGLRAFIGFVTLIMPAQPKLQVRLAVVLRTSAVLDDCRDMLADMSVHIGIHTRRDE
jgi:hypothetical protein